MKIKLGIIKYLSKRYCSWCKTPIGKLVCDILSMSAVTFAIVAAWRAGSTLF